MDDLSPSDLKTILHSKRANLYYLQHCRVLVNGGRVEYVTDEGSRSRYWNIPIANTTSLLLGTGTSITQAAMAELQEHADHEETSQFLITAIELADSSLSPEQAIAFLGEGWVAEEALAIAVYCALVAKNFRHGVMLAVNHDGDSDSTGAIAGNILGVMYGIKAVPTSWLEPLELREVITEIANDLLAVNKWDVDEIGGKDNDWVWKKYPGF